MVHHVYKMNNIIHLTQYESQRHGYTHRSFTVAQLYYFMQKTQAYRLGDFGHVVTGKLRGLGIPRGVRMFFNNDLLITNESRR